MLDTFVKCVYIRVRVFVFIIKMNERYSLLKHVQNHKELFLCKKI